MYPRGLTTRQISEQIEEIYGFECSESFISDVTDKILQDIMDWQTRPLDEVYPILFMDAVHFSVREDNRVKERWEEKYSNSMKSWEQNWGKVCGEFSIMYGDRFY